MVRKQLVGGVVAAMLLSVTVLPAKPPVAEKSGAGTIVIVFRDGHRQTFIWQLSSGLSFLPHNYRRDRRRG